MESTLSEYFNFCEVGLSGKRLNRSYGYIGAEQHLMRFAGDNKPHFSTESGEMIDYASGMAPGRGVGVHRRYREGKVLHLYRPFYHQVGKKTQNELYNFFKFRKMLIVNAENGK